tara:strand:- start:1112 stop:1540 length:429 start_codon:yes stop_codon:yes gene_type:complete
MDNKIILKTALSLIENTLDLTNDNEYRQTIHDGLSVAKSEIERQLTVLGITFIKSEEVNAKPDLPPEVAMSQTLGVEEVEIEGNDPAKFNTYRIEEEGTTGWRLHDIRSTRLTREEAAAKIDQLVEDGTNPGRLRVVVDGRV